MGGHGPNLILPGAGPIGPSPYGLPLPDLFIYILNKSGWDSPIFLF